MSVFGLRFFKCICMREYWSMVREHERMRACMCNCVCERECVCGWGW